MCVLVCRFLVDQGAIKPLCDLLSVPDVRIVTVALEGLENILKVRELAVKGTCCWLLVGWGFAARGMRGMHVDRTVCSHVRGGAKRRSAMRGTFFAPCEIARQRLTMACVAFLCRLASR